MTGLAAICLFAAVAGLTAHLGYFIHGERHEEAADVIALSTITSTLMFLVQLLYLQQGFMVSVYSTAAILAAFASALWTSMVVYRLFFHRLRHFPGPVGARVSKFWHSYHVLPRMDSFRWLDRMYHEYGDFVRTGILSLVALISMQPG